MKVAKLRTRKRWLVGSVILIGVIVVLALAWWWPKTSAHDTSAPGGPPDPSWYLYAADSHGAVIEGTHGMVGIARSGKVRWRSHDDAAVVACHITCPDAVLSGSDASMRSALVTTHRPRYVGSDRAALPTDTHTQEYVLAWDKTSLVRYVSDKGRGRWQVRTDGHNTSRAADGAMPMWVPNSDGSAAIGLLQSITGGHSLAQLFIHHATGWELAGPVMKSKSIAVCVSAGGRHYVLGGDRRLHSLAGPTVTLEGNGRLGACTFTRDHVVSSSNSMTMSDGHRSYHTTLVTYTLAGKKVHTRRVPREAVVVGDVRSDRFLVVGGGEAAVFDARTGRRVWHHRGVAAATFDERGEVVVVDHDGSVRWKAVG